MRALLLGVITLAACAPSDRRQVVFDKRVLDSRFFAEGVAVFDVDRDGVLDIVSAEQWFLGPDFTARAIGAIAPLDPATQYSTSFINYPMDVDSDGFTDLVAFGFPLFAATWRKNPGGSAGDWQQFPLWGEAPQESPRVIGRQAIFHTDATHMGLFTPGADPTVTWSARLLELPAGVTPLPSHGLGIGDLDGDGRDDIITVRGFWSNDVFTEVDLGPDCAQMQVLDVNGDGLPDLATSSAHGVGVYWHEQVRSGGKISFVRHTIFEGFSQSHALEIGDVNGDGLPDLITGKRMWAHGPTGDIDPDAPKVLYWFELVRDPSGAHFVPHQIDDDSGVGTQFVVIDVDADGRLDIVTASKRGLHYFHQR